MSIIVVIWFLWAEINGLFLLKLNVRWLASTPVAQASINKDGLEFEIDDVAVD